MIRVHCPPDYQSGNAVWPYLASDLAYYDFEDATAAQVCQDGALLLTRVEVRSVLSPLTGKFEKQFSNPQLVVIFPAGMWGPIEAFDDDEPVGGELQA